jgi:hypothetical protein
LLPSLLPLSRHSLDLCLSCLDCPSSQPAWTGVTPHTMCCNTNTNDIINNSNIWFVGIKFYHGSNLLLCTLWRCMGSGGILLPLTILGQLPYLSSLSALTKYKWQFAIMLPSYPTTNM